MQARVISAWQPNMKTRSSTNDDREQAGQLCIMEPVFMQMTRNKKTRKESSGDGSHSRRISREDAEGLFKGIVTALPTASGGPRGSAATWLPQTPQKTLRGETDPLLHFVIFLVPCSRLQRFFCSDLERNRGGFVWGGVYHGNMVLSPEE